MTTSWRRNLTTAIGLLVVCVAHPRAHGAPLSAGNIELGHNSSRGALLIGTELSHLSFGSGSSISTAGAQLGFQYGLSPRFAATGQLGFGLQAGGSSVGLASTGLSLIGSYALWGRFITGEETLSIEGRPWVRKITPRGNIFSLGAGIEQLILNGSQTVYPAPGLTGKADYQFGAWNRTFATGVRVSALTASEINIVGVSLYLVVVLGL